MGIRGRKPKATILKLLDGNPGKRPINVDEPIPLHVVSEEPPDRCTEMQKEIWRNVVANAPAGMLRKIDEELLYAWVAAAATHRIAQDELIEKGHFQYSLKSGYNVANPAAGVANRAVNVMTKVAAELGFSPTARARLHTVPNRGEETKTSPFAKFANRA